MAENCVNHLGKLPFVKSVDYWL